MRREHPLLESAALAVLALAIAAPASAASNKAKAHDPAAVARLQSETGADVALSDATGAARFVRGRGRALGLAAGKNKAEHALAFFDTHGRAFGLREPRAELKLKAAARDQLGGEHFTYSQEHHGVPVFGATLKAHYDADGNLKTVNGTLVPDVDVNPAPSRSAEEAAAAALREVSGATAVRSSRLVIFREGLAKGVSGDNHLAYEVEVGDGASVREFVFVDAHTGKVIDRFSGIQDALDRRAYDAMGATAPGPNYPAAPFWVEGDPFPTASAEADNMISASGETYGLFSTAFGRDSFDGAGATMDSIFNRGNGCPNASWNGVFISFCPGLTTDDITAHEWGHAYTQYTHNLIYQWQPGALNEAYSDIWGETVDLINGRGLDSPGGPRTANACSAFTTLPPVLHVNTPAAIAGDYPAGAAQFGPPLTPAGLTGDVVLVNDGVGNATPPTGAAGDLSVMDGCEAPFVNAGAIAGKVAMVYRGTCAFALKVKNAQNAGAIGVIVANHTLGGNGVITMGGADPTITIPSLSVGNANGELIRAQLGVGVNATLRLGGGQPIDNSYRWLQGEEATGFGGAIRDLWNPTCYSDPGKVSDTQYVCSTADNGGVHSNSGIPNHAYALLVDGGTYNGQTIGAIGLTKAAHIYFRASTVYQHSASDFADHADALEQSCSDLVGSNLSDLLTGAPSGQIITAGDCVAVAAAVAAVELRTPPTQCNFQPLLAKDPPPLCEAGALHHLFKDNFDHGNSSAARWRASHSGTTADFTPRDWVLTSDLPDDRGGKGFFGINPDIGTCAPGGDETAVLHLVSPQIAIPASNANLRLTFDHWIATEAGWDGGNLKISVNGGPWQLVAPGDFLYNPYNTTLFTAAQGNTNPIAGEPAYSGTDGGSVEGSWGRSIVNLAPYAGRQDKIRLRFDIGNDGCTGRFGWYLDDLMVYTCRSPDR